MTLAWGAAATGAAATRSSRMSRAPVRRWRVLPADGRRSMRMSARSAQPRTRFFIGTGAARRPWSLPIWIKRLAVAEAEIEEAAVGGVEHAKAVEAGFEFDVGADLPVNEDSVGAELRDPGAGRVSGDVVEELSVGDEVTVVEDNGDLVLALGEVESVFVLVADEEHAEEAGVGVDAVDAHRVVVVPEGGGILLQGIVRDFGVAGGEPVFGVAVALGARLGAMDVDDGTDLGDVLAGAVQGVVDGEEVLGGEVVDPVDVERLVGANLEGGAEGVGAVAPHAGDGHVPVDLGVDLAHGDGERGSTVMEGGGDNRRDGKGIDEGREGQRVEHGRRDVRRIRSGSCGAGALVILRRLAGHRHGGRAGSALRWRARSGEAEGSQGGLLEEGAAGFRQESDSGRVR